MKSVAQPLDSSETRRLVDQAAQGDDAAWGRLVGEHRGRLLRMVSLRMDRRLQGRVDPSDVLQEACVDAARRLPEYVDSPTMPFFLWLRFLTGQRLQEQHRRHLGAKGRDAGREVAFYRDACPEATSADLAARFLSNLSTPSRAVIREEQKLRVQLALDALEPIDREILALRHFEQLSNGETAEVLGLDKSAASKRYARALVRLKDVLLASPDSDQEFSP
jgi:RNA polymerase sigma-70 factor (ECF subfamily)